MAIENQQPALMTLPTNVQEKLARNFKPEEAAGLNVFKSVLKYINCI
jgi:hypothetical protein